MSFRTPSSQREYQWHTLLPFQLLFNRILDTCKQRRSHPVLEGPEIPDPVFRLVDQRKCRLRVAAATRTQSNATSCRRFRILWRQMLSEEGL